MVYSEKIIQAIKDGQVGIMPTDTIYGLVGSALDRGVVERISKLKQRDETRVGSLS